MRHEQIDIMIARTPYHLMICHVLAYKLVEKCSTNKKLLIVTGSVPQSLIKSMIDIKIWDEVLFPKISKKKWFPVNADNVDEWIATNLLKFFPKKKIEQRVFIGDDKNWLDQILITGLPNAKFYLFEDGLGSYLEFALPIWDRLYRGIFLRLIFRKRLINVAQVSHAVASGYYAFDATAFPWRHEESPLTILDLKNSKYLLWVGKQNVNCHIVELFERADLVLMSQNYCESNRVHLKDDLKIHQQISQLKERPELVLVKKHPGEQDDLHELRRKAIQASLPNSEVQSIKSPLPIEIFLAATKGKPTVCSLTSTALINIKRLRPELKVYHGYDLVYPQSNESGFFRHFGVKPISETWET